jgi:uncharacterized protein YjiS (DUF1127 family)
MAIATHPPLGLHIGASLGTVLRTALARRADRARRDRAYRKTYRELDQMSDRDLADIGITRFMIADVAAEAAALA